MGSTWKVLVFAALVAVSFTAPAQDLTESEVKAVLDRMDAAVAKRDVDAIGRLLSAGAQLSGTLKVGAEAQTFSYNKPEYLQSLRESWAQLVDYGYQRSNPVIVVSGRAATATADVLETLVFPAGKMSVKSRESVTLERVDGAVLITRVVAEASM